MKKWRNKAAPDDPDSWADVSCMWPTPQGTYEVADFYSTSSSLTATGETSGGVGSGLSAWAFRSLTGPRVYVVGAKIWELSGGTLTDRTGGLTLGSPRVMTQFGSATILARGTTQSLAVSTGGNFSAIAGSPSAVIVVIQSNAVVAFNTNTSVDGWAASDVGDHTNWSTGESASGRILDHAGPITAAVPFGNDILVFKQDAIYRMTYVGGTVKWQLQRIWEGIGAAGSEGINPIEACGDCVIYTGRPSSNALFTPDKAQIYRFDGISAPVHISRDIDLNLLETRVCYDPSQRRVMLLDFNAASVVPHYYALDQDAWGRGNDLFSLIGQVEPLVLRGDYSAAISINSSINSSARPIFAAATNAFKQYLPIAPGGSTSSSAYIKSWKYGAVDGKATFGRVTPLLRRRVNNSGGSPACALTVDLFRERHDTTAATTRSITESTVRKRFDILDGTCTDNFAQFKITFTDMDAEVDDLLVGATPSGAE